MAGFVLFDFAGKQTPLGIRFRWESLINLVEQPRRLVNSSPLVMLQKVTQFSVHGQLHGQKKRRAMLYSFPLSPSARSLALQWHQLYHDHAADIDQGRHLQILAHARTDGGHP